MNRSKELPLSRNDPGTKPHPHRASAGPVCCSAGVPGPAMQHGGGSKLKGLWGRCPQPPSPCGFAHVGDRCPLLGLLPQAPMPMRFQVPGACCSWLRLDRILVDAPGSCFAGAPGLSTEAQ